MKIVALLPMKDNSERVPGKNFKILGDKPLYRWMLDKLLNIDIIDAVIINTDSPRLLNNIDNIESNKLVIRKRRKEICGDFVSMNEVIKDDIHNVDADIYLMTHSTNPFLSKSSIISAISKFIDHIKNQTADSIFSVTKVQERFYDVDIKPINHDPNVLLRTQDLEAWYIENSNFYLFTKESFTTANARIGKLPKMFETNSYESLDIDNKDDWEIANMLASNFNKEA